MNKDQNPNTELEKRYESKFPLRTLYRIMGVKIWEHLRLLSLFFLKMLPQLFMPLVIAESIRVAQSDTLGWDYLMLIYGMFFVIVLANVPLHFWFVRGFSNVTRSMELSVRAALVRRLQQLSMHYHSEKESGRLQSKVLRDVEELVRLCELYFQTAMGSLLGAAFAFIYTLVQDPKIAISYIVLAPLSIIIVQVFKGIMRRRNDDLRHDVESMSQRVSEMIDMVPVTRAHGLEDVEIDTVSGRLEHVRQRGRKVDSINALFGASGFVVFMLAILGITAMTTWLVIGGTLSLDKIALYAALFQMVIGSINQLINMAPQIAKSMASVRSIGEILECPDLEDNEGKKVVDSVAGEIEFRDLTFSYPKTEAPAVNRLNLRVESGSCVAFVGESGSGKSTLMQLAIGFLRPQEGEVFLDGQPMRDLDMRTWRRHIAMVPQQTILFSGTIRENISYGRSIYSEEDIWAAVEAANLRAVIEQLPNKLDTKVGENGLKMSGGQRQRLAIARAVIRDPRVIILDEATSALDVISEREVQVAIENLIKGRTTFIVAHRLSTIRQADLIVVMDKGSAIEIGTPVELSQANGPFARLKAFQS